ncbi:PAS domain-containing protein [Echinicola sp. CAU 1574]|uniref:histidine kinase n=1 Tax=Echinicola arenosa TaxID=2774144 RepID=A0ABR9AJA2_9BACT|nr:PAS domain-containing protein [Echinicola arenosa]MBD8488821.1 PAS domain-containing protein [Echinicola arenosa]
MTLPKPSLGHIFNIFKQNKTLSSILFTQQGTCFPVLLEGNIVKEQKAENYLINLIMIPQLEKPGIKNLWMIQLSTGLLFSSSLNKCPSRLKIGSALPNHFHNHYPHISEAVFQDFITNDQEGQLDLQHHGQILEKEFLFDSEYCSLIVHSPAIGNRFQKFITEQKDQMVQHNSRAIYYEHELGDSQIHWSGAYVDIVGYPREEFTEVNIQRWVEMIHPEDLKHLKTGFEKDFKLDNPYDTFYRLKHKEGHYLYVQDIARVFVDEKTGKKIILGSITDISGLKNIEKKLLENRYILNELSSIMPGMIYMFKRSQAGKHEFMFVSEGVKEIFGVTSKYFSQHFRKLKNRIHPDDLQSIIDANQNATNSKKLELNFRILNPDETIKWVFCSSSLLKEQNGQDIWAGYILDISYTKKKEEEAKSNYMRYKQSFDNNPLAIFHYDKDGIILKVNKTLIKKAKIEKEERMLGKSIHNLYKKSPIYPYLLKGIESGYADYEGSFNSYFSKTHFYINLKIRKLEFDNGYEAAIDDITEKDFVQCVLNDVATISAQFSDVDFFNELVKLLSKKLNLKYCLIGEYIPHARSIQTTAIAKKGKIIPNFTYSLQHTPCETAISDRKREVVMISNGVAEQYPKDLFLIEENITSYCSTGINDKNGRKIGILVLADSKPMHNEDGIINIVSILGDRAGAELQRIRYEKKLLESQQLYKSIAENFPRGTVDVLDKNFRYIYTEGSEYQKIGMDPKELIGTYHLMKYDAVTSLKAKKELDKVLIGQTVVYEINFNGESYKKTGVPLINKQGEVDRILLVTQNISESKSAEEEREKLIKDLSSHNDELQRFAYIVSHNLRAPIVNITSLLDLLNEDDLADPNNVELIDSLKTSVAILNATLMDLIEVVSIKKEKIRKVETVNFESLINNLEKSLFKQLKEAKVIVKRDFAINEINYVQSHLENFFLNFMTNAIKYSHPERNTEIHIKTKMNGDNCIISFSDNGIGIDLEKYGDRIFGLYQRFHTHVEGKGLGLYLVREQIRSLDGDIHIKSEVGKGTTFTITIKNLPHPDQESIEFGQENKQ